MESGSEGVIGPSWMVGQACVLILGGAEYGFYATFRMSDLAALTPRVGGLSWLRGRV